MYFWARGIATMNSRLLECYGLMLMRRPRIQFRPSLLAAHGAEWGHDV